ncbi:beta-lactamase/transpeptidase-like protein [Cristinia sonorae]|uniref:Beta-lactamase/transpeptidase-like protein n=1 Tax=Cristinia sonorae TaxID=1940300 RepID=A0A8K0UKK2_9AGAR|nr:beta-lactamase/transpeptidase-like protein [Cristinia sonorae]
MLRAALFVLLAAFTRTVLSQQISFNLPKKLITSQLSRFIQDLIATEHIPGLTLGLVHSDGQVEHGAWGRKDEDGSSTTVDTSFILASCSKAFLSASMGILMEDFAQGKNVTALPPHVNVFDWDTKVVDLLPEEWRLQDEWATKKVNIRDMLSHVSGIPRHDYSPVSTNSPHEILLNLRNLRPTYELREKWSYNNLMYISAAHLISVYSGIPYTDFVNKGIFIPLNMSSTTYSPAEAARDNDLTQSWTPTGRRIPTWFSDATRDLNAGPGGVISNAVDMTKWLNALLNKGVHKDTNTTVIPGSVLDAVTTSHAIVSGRGTSPHTSISGYGMGWSRVSYGGHEFVSHSGGIPGFSTMVGFLPADDLGIVVLANADAKHDAEIKLIMRIIRDAVGLDISDWEDVPSLTPKASLRLQKLAGPGLRTPIERFAGRYWDAGYGNLTLCAPKSTSPECREVLKTFSIFDDVTSEENRNTLYAAYPTMWSSHLRMTYVGPDDEDFVLSFTSLFPEGYGKDSAPFETSEEGEAEAEVKFVINLGVESGGYGVKVVAFCVMGGEEEQEGRKRLLRSAGAGYSILDVAEAVMTRVGDE